MFLSQAISFPPSLGIEWDLFLYINLVEEVPLEPVVVTCSDVELLFPEVPLLSDHARRGETGTFAPKDHSQHPSLAIAGVPHM